LPHLKRVQLDYFSEAVPRWLLFRQGYFDTSGIPKDAFNQAIGGADGTLTPEMAADGVLLNKSQVSELFYSCFNMHDPIVGKNKPLRQAMSMAFDREKFIEIYLNGRGKPANGLIPPGFPTYDENRKDPYTEFNLAAARKKMKEAVAINGGPIPELVYYIGDTSTEGRQQGEFFAQQMAQIGLKVRFELRTWARMLEMIDGYQAQTFTFGWVADYPDEQTFLQLFYSKNSGPGGVNSTAYANPEYDKLYEQAVVMEPSPQRQELYLKMQDIISEDCPVILEFYPIYFTLRYPWVHGWSPMEYGNGQKMSWVYISLDSKVRDEWMRKHR
jgi:ABC-type transport system substrate-binding protein